MAIAFAEIEAGHVGVLNNQADQVKFDDVDKIQHFTKTSRVEESQNPSTRRRDREKGVAKTRTPISSVPIGAPFYEEPSKKEDDHYTKNNGIKITFDCGISIAVISSYHAFKF